MPLANSATPTDSRFMALFVGPKHSGKTVAACSWIKEKKMVRIDDFDGRWKGILGAPWIDKSKVVYEYFPPKTGPNEKILFERLNDSWEAFEIEVKSGRSPYSLYVGDSITSLANDLLIDAIPLTHKDGRGKRVGTIGVADPGDYNFLTNNINSYLRFLRTLPIDIIVTAHVVPKWDKPRDEHGAKMQYADNIQVGEKLSLTDKLASNIPNYFDHIFRFDRRIVAREERFFVEYISDIACTSWAGFKPGEHDITGKDFRKFTLDLVSKSNGVETVVK